jgi:arginine decarboxylase
VKKIRITKGTGTGPTPLSAFDAALYAAGIGNYNLIHLSSVIPPDHEPVREQVTDNDDVSAYGKRLYLVYASAASTEHGMSAYAGLGWVMTESEPKRGLFVEHTGHSEEEVQKQIEKTLTSMVSYRKEKYGPVQSEIVGIECVNAPVNAIVAAFYENAPWEMTHS